MAQAESLKRLLESNNHDLEIEIVPVKTSGDRGERDRLGAFVREIQEALLDNRVDIALHCLKDLPTEQVSGLRLSAQLRREDPRDTLISPMCKLDGLAQGAIVGTGSVRRSSQIAAVRPDLVFRPLVGNVDTRIRKLLSGEYEAIVLAIAGLKRLGVLEIWPSTEYSDLHVEPLSVDEMLPAPGQAVLVLETRESDSASIGAARKLHHAETEACTTAERAFLAALGGGCSVPVAALGEFDSGTLSLRGLVASPDGRRVIRGSKSGTASRAQTLGAELAEELGREGAFDVLREVAGAAR